MESTESCQFSLVTRINELRTSPRYWLLNHFRCLSQATKLSTVVLDEKQRWNCKLLTHEVQGLLRPKTFTIGQRAMCAPTCMLPTVSTSDNLETETQIKSLDLQLCNFHNRKRSSRLNIIEVKTNKQLEKRNLYSGSIYN